jgi:hypothetical protein
MEHKRAYGGSILGRKWRTWDYAEGRAQNFYLWLKGWTIHVAIIRRPR